MTVISLDQIVKNILLKRRYPLQYYIDFLVYCRNGLREISFDIAILPLRYAPLPVNQPGNTVDWPNDYHDYTRLSAWVDGYIRPLVETNSLQLVPNYDSNFDIQPYSGGVAIDGANSQNQFPLFIEGAGNIFWGNNWNIFGEDLGRQFGGAGTIGDTFRVNHAERQFKINETICPTKIVLEYISDGSDADSATQINSYAQECIEAYAMWQFYLHNRTYSQAEAEVMFQHYTSERNVLVARISDLTLDRLKRIVQSNSISIKY
jgi:hypothetical protein